MKSLIRSFKRWMENFFTNLNDEVLKEQYTFCESIANESTWAVPTVITICLTDALMEKKCICYAGVLISLLFRHWQKNCGDTEWRVGSRKAIIAAILMLVLIFGCRGCCGKSSVDPAQTEGAMATEKTTTVEDIFGWDEIKAAIPGETIYFGEYRQHKWTDDKQKIAWIILEEADQKLLLLSKYCLDCREYNKSGEACTWETSSIREWLNTDFLMDAFSDQELEKIATTCVKADVNPDVNSVYMGNDTDDKIFLLSAAETTRYFKTAEERQAFPTEFALYNGAGYDRDLEGGPCWWWLRTPGQDNSHAADIKSGGAINCNGYNVASRNFSVRPALWLDLSVD